MADTISILDGSTFLVSDMNGDVDASPDEPHGSASPQAWATGTPLLLLRALLGLEPDGGELHCDPHLPEKIGRLELTRIPGRWGRMDVTDKEVVR